MGDFLTITVTSRPQPILTPNNPSALLFNNDLANVIYLGDNLGISSAQLDMGQIAPLGSVSFDLTKPGTPDYIYAACAPGQTAQILVLPGANNYSASPAQVAQQISALGLATLTAQNTQIGQLSSAPGTTVATDVSNTGTPLLHGINFLSAVNATAALGLGGSVSTNVPVKKPGYVIRVSAQVASAAATVPFLTVQVAFNNGVGSPILGVPNTWTIPMSSTASSWTICGSGPVRGPFILVTFTNLDPAFGCTVTYTILETTQHITRDDWRGPVEGSALTASIPQYTTAGKTSAAGGDITRGVLASINTVTIAAGATQTYLLPAFSGPVSGQIVASATCQAFLVSPVELSTSPGIGGAPLYENTSFTIATLVGLVLPRHVTRMSFTNGGGTSLTLNSFWLGDIENTS